MNFDAAVERLADARPDADATSRDGLASLIEKGLTKSTNENVEYLLSLA